MFSRVPASPLDTHAASGSSVPCECVTCLISGHLDLAHSLAMRYAGRGESIEDLVHVARVGLVLAAHRFDPGHGTPFGGYAVPTILGELRHHMRDHLWAIRPPRRLQEFRPECALKAEELAQALRRTRP